MAFSTERIGCTSFDNKHLLRYSARYTSIDDKKFSSFFGQLMKLKFSVFIIDKLDGDFERTRGEQVIRNDSYIVDRLITIVQSALN
jgi:hypothetical protein